MTPAGGSPDVYHAGQKGWLHAQASRMTSSTAARIRIKKRSRVVMVHSLHFSQLHLRKIKESWHRRQLLH